MLRPDARVELLDGQIIDRSPIGPFHGGVTRRLNACLSAHARGRWIVAIQDPVRLSDDSEPQPDLMLLKPSADEAATQMPRMCCCSSKWRILP